MTYRTRDYERVVFRKAEGIAGQIVNRLNGDYRVLRKRPPRPEEDPNQDANEMRKHLTTLVDGWLASDCDFETWQTENPEVVKQVKVGLRMVDIRLMPAPLTEEEKQDRRERKQAGRPLEPKGATYKVDLRTIGRLDLPMTTTEAETIWLFMLFITSPVFNRIARCERKLCPRYYLRTSRRRNKMYCSARCGRDISARKTTAKRRAEEHAQKLERVEQAIERFNKLKRRPREPWKQWVAKRAGVTKNFVTRNSSNLAEPIQESNSTER